MEKFATNFPQRSVTIGGMSGGRNNLRIPPQNLEAEAALLGSIMQRPDAMYELMDIISAESFYSERHRLVFNAMMELFKEVARLIFFLFHRNLKRTISLIKLVEDPFS